MMHKSILQKAAAIAGRAAQSMAKETTSSGWPNPCITILWQPKRPASIVNAAKQDKK